jgi:chromosome partitioning protein
MKTIAVYSLKGGVGKTITTATLAHMYAVGEKRKGNVLLVDADSQGNLSQYFKRYSKDDCGLHQELTTIKEHEWYVCGTDYATLDILTGGMQLYDDDRTLFKAGETGIMREVIDKYTRSPAERYDLCLIDCAPALNMLTINALCAADYVVIPIRADAFSANGLIELEEQLEGVRKVNSGLQVAGVVITHYQSTEVVNDAVQIIEKRFPVFKTKINYSKHVSKSTLLRKPLADMSARIRPTVQYRKLLNEICVRIGQTEE